MAGWMHPQFRESARRALKEWADGHVSQKSERPQEPRDQIQSRAVDDVRQPSEGSDEDTRI
jgi:hypothetical protein